MFKWKKSIDSNHASLIIIFISVVVILIFALKDIANLTGINVINDEFGYWGVAAQLAGNDWSDLLASTPYYSYGYSLLLVPLFWLKLPSELMYQIAILFNAGLLVASYFLCISCGKKLFPTLKKWELPLIALAVTLYSNTLIQAQIAWSETLLYVLYWIVFFFALSVLEKPSRKNVLAFLLSNICLYMVHQRTVGVVIASVIFLVILIFQKQIRIKEFTIPILCAGILFCTHMLIKGYAVNDIFANDAMVAMNNYSGQAGKIKSAFGSLEGIRFFLQSICGKLYYLGAATFLIGFTSAWFALKQSFACLKHITARMSFDKTFRDQLIGLLLFLSFGATFLINAIAMGRAEGRLDILLYGRYMEFAIGPVLVYGIGHFLSLEKPYITIIIEGILLLMLSVIVNKALIQSGSNSYNPYCATTLNYFFINKLQVPYLAYYITVIAILVPFALTLLLNQLFKGRLNFLCCATSCVILSVSWGYLAQNTPTKKEQPYIRNMIAPIVDTINGTGKQHPIVFLDEQKNDDPYYIPLKYIQFVFYDNPIQIISNLDELNDNDMENSFVLTLPNSNIEHISNESYVSVAASSQLSLYLPEKSPLMDDYKTYANELVHPMYDSMIINKSDDNVEPVSDYIVSGPYINLPRATYNVTYELEYTGNAYDIGFCDISAEGGNSILQSISLNSDMFDQGRAKITLDFSLYSWTSDIEFRVWSNEGNKLNLTNLYYRKQADHYAPGLDNPSDWTDLCEKISFDHYKNSILYLNSTKDMIDLSYLENQLPEYQISVVSSENMELPRPASAYVIADKAYLDWMSLLPDYTVLAQYENHLLLAPTDSITEDTSVLSDGTYADLKLIQKKQESSYMSQIYTLPEGGEYLAALNLPDMDVTGRIHVEVLSGKSVMEEIEAMDYEKTVMVPFESYSSVGELSFRIYSEEEQMQIPYISGSICQLRDQITYSYDRQLKPLLTLSQKVNNTRPVTIVGKEWKKKDKENIQNYLSGKEVVFWEYPEEKNTKKEDKEERPARENAIAKYPKEPWFIIPANTSMIYELLSEYTVADRTDWYALVVKNSQMGHIDNKMKHPLSTDMTLSAEFFETVNEDGIVQRNISIPGGTYDLLVEAAIQNTPAVSLETGGELGKIRVWSGDKLWKTYPITNNLDSITVSSQNGISNLRFDVLETYPGTIKAKLTGIRKRSDGYQINLNQMQSFAGTYDELSDTITTSGDTIYGPYTSLPAGDYEVSFIYDSDSPGNINFDIAHSGGQIMDTARITKRSETSEGYQITISMNVEEDIDEVEFRTYVPEGVQCVLKAIIVSEE